MRHHLRLRAVLVASLVALGACSGTSTPSADPTASDAVGVDEVPRELSPEERGLNQLSELVDDDGRLTSDQVLAMWAARVAPLPGVDPLPAEQVADIELDLILGAAGSRLDLFTAEQRERILAVLDQESTELPQAQPASFRPGRTLAQIDDATIDAYYRNATTELERTIGQPIGIPVLPVVVGLRTPDPDNCDLVSLPGEPGCPFAVTHPGVGAITRPVAEFDGVVRNCRLMINRDVALPVDRSEAQRFMIGVIAHELYHCHQAAVIGTHVGMDRLPMWVREGTAAWAGEKSAGGTNYSERGWWQRWLGEPSRALFRRSYDAMGLFWMIDLDLDSPIFGRLDAVLRSSTSSNDDALRALIEPVAARVWTRWATQSANDRAGGAAWYPQGPRATADRGVVTAIVPAPGGDAVLVSPGAPNASRGVRFDFSAEAVELFVPAEAGAGLVVADGTRLELAASTTKRLCRDGICPPCPDGTTPASDGGIPAGTTTLYAASHNAAVSVRQLTTEQLCAGATTTTAPGEPGDPNVICNSVLPPAEAETLLGGAATTGHDYGIASDNINYPTYTCRWTVGSKYLYANLETRTDGSQRFHGTDQFNVDTTYTPVSIGSEARFAAPKRGSGVVTLEIVANGNLLTVVAEGPIQGNTGLMASAGRTIVSNWPPS